jgi:hypothetical protein
MVEERKTPAYQPRGPWHCPHCHAASTPVSCVRCQRQMCEDCISYHSAGKVCGLCFDQMAKPDE